MQAQQPLAAIDAREFSRVETASVNNIFIVFIISCDNMAKSAARSADA